MVQLHYNKKKYFVINEKVPHKERLVLDCFCYYATTNVNNVVASVLVGNAAAVQLSVAAAAIVWLAGFQSAE